MKKEQGPRYDEGVEDAELDLETSGLPAQRLLRQAEYTLADTPEEEEALVEYRQGRRDRLFEATKEAEDAERASVRR